jgi:hypothetical protein
VYIYGEGDVEEYQATSIQAARSLAVQQVSDAVRRDYERAMEDMEALDALHKPLTKAK